MHLWCVNACPFSNRIPSMIYLSECPNPVWAKWYTFIFVCTVTLFFFYWFIDFRICVWCYIQCHCSVNQNIFVTFLLTHGNILQWVIPISNFKRTKQVWLAPLFSPKGCFLWRAHRFCGQKNYTLRRWHRGRMKHRVPSSQREKEHFVWDLHETYCTSVSSVVSYILWAIEDGVACRKEPIISTRHVCDNGTFWSKVST